MDALKRAELLEFSGISRTVLEARIRALIAVLDAVEERLAARRDNSARTSQSHPDSSVREQSAVRAQAYQTAIEEVRDLLDVPHRDTSVDNR